MSLWRVQAACLGRRDGGAVLPRRPGRGVRTRPRSGAVAQRGGQTEQQQQGSGQDEPGAHGAHLASGPGPGAAWWWPEARRAAAAWRRREPAPPWPVARPPTGRWRRRRRGGRAAGAAARCPAAAPAAWQHAEQGRTQRSGQPRRTRWVGHDRRQRLPRLAGAERGHSFHREVQGRGQRPQVGRRRRAPGRWPGSRPGGRPPAGAPRPGCPAAQGRAARPGRSAAAPPARPAHAATARRPAHHQQRPAVLHEHVVQHHRAGMAEPGRQPRLAEHPVAQPRPSGRRGGRSDAAHPCLLRQRGARTGSGRHRRPERAPRGAPRNGARGAGRSGQETGGLAGERRTEAYSVFGGVGSALCGTLLVVLRGGLSCGSSGTGSCLELRSARRSGSPCPVR
jgi:translation initiation factor IF-2